MKLRDLKNLFGIKPKPVSYGFQVNSFDLPQDGRVEYAQWLHPAESPKTIEQSVVDELRRYISPGDVAIDIGAHTGDTTIPLALAAEKNGCVIALEPNSYVFPVLEKNASLNLEKTKIKPLNFAATLQSGEFEFEYSDAGFCNGGFHEGISKWRHGHAFELKVRGENVGNYLESNFPELIPRITFIKIDAEGYDYSILKSIENLILKQKPFIKCEVYKHLNEEKRRKLFEYVSGFGYKIYKVEQEDDYKGEAVTIEKLMNWKHYDIFAVPDSKRTGLYTN